MLPVQHFHMAKNSMENIREDKNKLIKELTKDARQSTNELSEKLGFSRQKIWRMIKDIEESGDIWGYSAVVKDYGEANKIYFALIKQNIPYLSNINEIINNVKTDNSGKNGIKLIGLYKWSIRRYLYVCCKGCKRCEEIFGLYYKAIQRFYCKYRISRKCFSTC